MIPDTSCMLLRMLISPECFDVCVESGSLLNSRRSPTRCVVDVEMFDDACFSRVLPHLVVLLGGS